MTLELLINSVWRFNEVDGFPNGFWRLISLPLETEALILVQITGHREYSRPQRMQVDFFLQYTKEQIVQPHAYRLPAYQLRADEDIPESHRRIRDEKFKTIEAAIRDEFLPLRLAVERSSSLLSSYAKKAETSRKNLARSLNNYWQYGQQKNALLPAFSNCGSPGKDRVAHEVKRGRPRKNKVMAFRPLNGHNMDEALKSELRKLLKKYYLKPEPKTLQFVHRKLINKCFKEEVLKAEIEGRKPDTITYRQVVYWAPILVDKVEAVKRQNTEANFQLQKRALISSATVFSPVPGVCFEIDATVSNVHLVSSKNANHCIGRATVYAIVDKASRLIVGLYIGLEHEGWTAVRQALMNCITSKVEYCARYGIEIEEEEWPCRHLSLTLLGDKGAFYSKKVQDACISEVTLDMTGTGRGDMKAIVERRFKHFDNELWDDLPGTTRGKHKTRGDPDPRLKAKITLQQFTKLMIEEVLDHNNRRHFDELARNELIVENDLAPTPLNFWNIHAQKLRTSLRLIEKNQALSALLAPVKASVTDRGIYHEGIYYVCDLAIAEGWFVEARSYGRFDVDARISLDDSSEFYVRRGPGSDFVRCRVKSGWEIFDGLPNAELLYLKDWKQEKDLIHEFSAEDFLKSDRRRTVKVEAKKAQKAAPKNKTKKEKWSNIRERRREELEIDGKQKQLRV